MNPLIPAPHIKGLIFDLDGTLADTMPLHLEAWSIAGAVFNIDITRQMVEDRAGTPTLQVIKQLNKLYDWQIDPVAFRIEKNKAYLNLKSQSGKIRPIQSVMSIAKRFYGALPLAVGTGSIKRNAEMALQDLGITELFKGVVTADDVTNHKPHPETFLKCAAFLKVAPEHCLVYEDGQMGIDAALAGGMSAVHVKTLELFHP